MNNAVVCKFYCTNPSTQEVIEVMEEAVVEGTEVGSMMTKDAPPFLCAIEKIILVSTSMHPRTSMTH